MHSSGESRSVPRWHPAVAESGQAPLIGPLALPGGYPNLVDPRYADQVAQLYRPNTGRLLDLKQRYDPNGVFTATPLSH